jgi:hypothetical protein
MFPLASLAIPPKSSATYVARGSELFVVRQLQVTKTVIINIDIRDTGNNIFFIQKIRRTHIQFAEAIYENIN